MRRFHAAPRATLAITLLLIFLSAGCSKGTGSGGGASNPPAGGGSATNPVTKTQVIGIEGGEIVADDGTWKLTVPAFALRFPQEITITSDATPVGTVGSEYRKVSKAFKFEPHGLFFDVPASFWFKYEQGDLAEGSLQENLIALHYVHDDSKLERTRTTVNTGLNEATSAMQHFSIANGLTNRIENVIDGTVTNTNPVQNTANDLVFHFAQLADDAARQAEYLAYQTLIDAFVAKTEQILGYNPLFQAFPGIFPTGTTGGYNVIYNANGAESGIAPSDSTIYPTGNNATVLGNTGSMTRAYHTFAGWNTAADGSGTLYVVGASLAIASANVMLHAQWVEDPKYTITYHANTSTGGTVPIDAGQYYAGMSVIVSANTGGLYKASSIFLGWNTQADGNGTDFPTVSALSMPATNLALYAKWAPQYTRIYSAVGATIGGGFVRRDQQGNLYLVGMTTGSYCGESIVGVRDIMLAKLNAKGDFLWCRIIGSPGLQHVPGRLSLGPDGSVFLAGRAWAGLNGQAQNGLADAFVMKYDGGGTHQWTRQFGSPGTYATATDVAVLPDGNIRFVGNTTGALGGTAQIGNQDGIMVDLDANGNLLNVERVGASAKYIDLFTLAIDPQGNTCVVGKSNGNIHGETVTGSSDRITIKYDSAKNRQWTRLAGAAHSGTLGFGAALDSDGNCYTFGYRNTIYDGVTNVNWYDYVVVKYLSNGDIGWSQVSSSHNTYGTSIHVNQQQEVFLVGQTRANLDGQILTGLGDAYFIKFNASGVRQYTRLFGVANQFTEAVGFAPDIAGGYYLIGSTKGNLDGQTLLGPEGMFLSTKFSDVAPPVNSITYAGNGNTSGTVPVDANTYVHGATVTVKPRASNFKRDNFAFAGWNTQSDGSGNTRLPGEQFSMGPSAESLHARWRNKWTRLHGEAAKNTTVEAIATSADGFVYSVGDAPAGFLGELPSNRSGFILHKRDLNGAEIWRRVGYSDGNRTLALSVQVDSQNRVLVAGQTNGSISSSSQIGRTDGFIAIFSAAGVFTQVIRVGAPNANVYIRKIKIDAQDNIYAIGQTTAGLDGQNLVGAEDTFIKKFSRTGVLSWSQHIGAPGAYVRGADIDIFGSTFYVVGSTNAALSTDAFAGYWAGFISRRSAFNGMPVWTRTFGMPRATTSFTGVARSGCMHAYVIGETYASLYTPRLVKYSGWHKLAFVGNYTDLGQTFFANNQEQGIPIGSIIESDYGTSAIGVACQNNFPTGLFSIHGNYWVQGYQGAIAGLGSSTAILFSPTQGITNNRLLAYGAAGTVVRPTGLVADFLGVWHVAGYTYGALDGQILTGTQDAFLTNRLGW